VSVFLKLSFTSLERKSIPVLVILASLLLIGGAVYSARLGDSFRYLSDEYEYVVLARNLARYNMYSLDGASSTAYRPPGYPAVLSVLAMLGGDIPQLRFLNFVFLSGSVYLIGRIMLQQGLPCAAVISSLLVIAYPVLFYTSGTFYPQTLASFLFLIILKTFTKIKLRPGDFVVGGLIFGFLVLTVPAFFYAIFVIWGWFFLTGRYLQARSYVLTLVSAFLIIGLWTARNYLVFDTFFFVSTNSGENLLIGNTENSTPTSGTQVDISKYLSRAAGLGEAERDKFFTQQAVQFINDHPVASLKLYLLKVLNYFNYRNELVTLSEGSEFRDLLMLFTYGPLMAIFLLRLLLIKQAKATPVEILFILLYLSSALVSAVFFTRIRFRLPFDYLMIMVVAITLDRVIRIILNRKQTITALILERSG
jgi:hypothetical protein